MSKRRTSAALVTGAGLLSAAVAFAGPANAATVSAAHVDIVSIQCTPNAAHTAGTLQLGTNIETGSGETFVPAASTSGYDFHYTTPSSYINYVTTSGTAGYYSVANDSNEQSTEPWIGFAYDEENDCAGISLPTVTIKLTKAAGTNRIYANPAAGVLDTDSSTASITLSRGSHQHTVWRYYAPSRTAQNYKPTFTVSGAISGTVKPTISIG